MTTGKVDKILDVLDRPVTDDDLVKFHDRIMEDIRAHRACVVIGKEVYPLGLDRSGFRTAETPNGSGRALHFYARLVKGPDLLRETEHAGPSLYAHIGPAHSVGCHYLLPPSKRRKRPCNCGAEELWRKLVEQAGEPYEHLPGYETLEKQFGRSLAPIAAAEKGEQGGNKD